MAVGCCQRGQRVSASAGQPRAGRPHGAAPTCFLCALAVKPGRIPFVSFVVPSPTHLCNLWIARQIAFVAAPACFHRALRVSAVNPSPNAILCALGVLRGEPQLNPSAKPVVPSPAPLVSLVLFVDRILRASSCSSWFPSLTHLCNLCNLWIPPVRSPSPHAARRSPPTCSPGRAGSPPCAAPAPALPPTPPPASR